MIKFADKIKLDRYNKKYFLWLEKFWRKSKRNWARFISRVLQCFIDFGVFRVFWWTFILLHWSMEELFFKTFFNRLFLFMLFFKANECPRNKPKRSEQMPNYFSYFNFLLHAFIRIRNLSVFWVEFRFFWISSRMKCYKLECKILIISIRLY